MARILVIDDEEEICEILRESLGAAGHEVVVAANGRAGVRAHRERPADLVITDIFMPEQEGIETIIELRRDFPDVKIIVMSGGGRLAGGDYLLAARQLGAARAVEKPFHLREMLDAVRDVLDA